ncbi:MAG: aldo/keto reductase [Chloroflexota bacterium]
MQYRAFGKLDWQVSALGFGAMRLPVIDGDRTRIDEPLAQRMIRYAIDHGVNYLDTAYAYHGGGSESFVGRVLREGYRERVKLATKMPSWLIQKAEDFDRYLDEQLQRLQTGHLDFYLLHGLNRERWPLLRDLGVRQWAERAMADGRFHHLGFSFHDDFGVFKDILDAFEWTLCQIQYNFMDVDYQAGVRGLRYAAEKGLAVVVMEPIRGGRLSKKVPPMIQAIWESASQPRRLADWALQWVWNQPEVSVALSGMSAMEHVVENVASAAQSGPGTLTENDLALITRVRDAYWKLCPVPCTNCQYCLPCPSGVNIPRILELYNDAIMYGDDTRAPLAYSWLKEDERANLCVACGDCLTRCPQQIDIPNWLIQAHELLCP